MRHMVFVIAVAWGLAPCAPAHAGSVSEAAVTTSAGQAVRLGAYTVFRRDCSGGVAAEVRPAGDQRSGVLIVAAGTLATTRVPNCGRIEAPAQIVTYRPNPGFTGTERITYDVVDTATGRSQTHVVSVNVTN